MDEKLQFRISSALKDIIGRDLITDDYVAVFELVKNAFDAYATEVTITFQNIYSENAKIIIKDNGKGMSLKDLKVKWLFVAYSAKKEGTEDENYDYRNRIRSNKVFAGAKGIGRFSCDRLGKTLFLETTKIEDNPKTETLLTHWEKFEQNIKDEFINISVLHETKKSSGYGVANGTVLEISDLRSNWDRKKLLKLKDSLSKLINPYNDNKQANFKIFIDVPEELDNDKNAEEYRNKVNGEVENFLFETLELKTTSVIGSIDNHGQSIKTKLVDGGTKIYEISQDNKFSILQNVKVTLYYLNRASKLAFHKKMGMASRVYGNVFLYINGFRVYPYGEPFSDAMGIDKRKSRKRMSLLGTGELMGMIEIVDFRSKSKLDSNKEFNESASRGDGLSKNEAYFELEKFFFSVLEKLERYVVDVQQWGLSIEDQRGSLISSRVIDLLSKITNSTEITDFSVPDDFLELIEVSQSQSADTVVENLSRIANEIGDERLFTIAEKALTKVNLLQEARKEAEKEAKSAVEIAEKATQKLKTKVSENLFLKSINTSDYKEMISLLHHIGIYAGTIDNNLKGISLRVQNNIPLSNDELYDIIRQISLNVKKISSIVVFATKAKFNLKTESKTLDLNNYIREYVENIVPAITDKTLSIEFVDEMQKEFIMQVKPIEINIIIDNLISNAKKANATFLNIKSTQNEDSSMTILFEDNGIGIAVSKIGDIFNMGYTTTDGAGVGLYHVKEIVKRLGAKISIKNNDKSGVTFSVTFKEKS